MTVSPMDDEMTNYYALETMEGNRLVQRLRERSRRTGPFIADQGLTYLCMSIAASVCMSARGAGAKPTTEEIKSSVAWLEAWFQTYDGAAQLSQSRITDKKDALRVLVPPFGEEYVDETFRGNVNSVESLINSCHDWQRAPVVRLLYSAPIDVPAFRAAIESALVQTHFYNQVRAEAGTWKRFVEWLRYADFEIPTTIPDPVTIYRGCHGIAPSTAATGIWWTLARKAAIRFANNSEVDPVVVRAVVPRSTLLFYSFDDDPDHAEEGVIPSSLPPDEWQLDPK